MLPVTDHIDPAYWTLVVETKFYVWAALLYFLQKQHFVRNLVVVCAVMTILYTIDDVHPVRWIKLLSIVTFGQYAMLFAAGVAFQRLNSRPGGMAKWWPYLAVAVGGELTRISITADTEGIRMSTAVFEIAFFLAFLAVAFGWQAPKSRFVDVLARIGLVSYPVYLLHQNIGVGLLNRTIGESPLVILGVFVTICAALIAAGLFLHENVERPGKRLILSLLLPPKVHRLRPGV
jgi:peptidoglycan/LPS O-acetylase OafA/YrhL